jgi:phosphohistidine phosphatase
MTKTLILMRHAKSDWDDPKLDDHDRPLNKRGRRSAIALGNWLRDSGWMPDQALVSTATRTGQTFELLNIAVPVAFRRGLYHASPDQMLKHLTEVESDTVLMIGHNPGIATFANALVQKWPDHERFLDYPTGSTLVVQFDADRWDQIQPGTGVVLDFVIPRELPKV